VQIVRTETLVSAGAFPTSASAGTVLADIRHGIAGVVWPSASTAFTLFDERMGNGVKPIKNAFVNRLVARGWQSEQRLNVAARLRPGPIDVLLRFPGTAPFAVEWETGNISSTHRAINKIALGMLDGALCGGAVILPTRRMYYYLTDRIGNFEEIEPYFPVWRNLPATGLLMVIAVEHDAVSRTVPRIPKGTDGRALV